MDELAIPDVPAREKIDSLLELHKKEAGGVAEEGEVQVLRVDPAVQAIEIPAVADGSALERNQPVLAVYRQAERILQL